MGKAQGSHEADRPAADDDDALVLNFALLRIQSWQCRARLTGFLAP